MANEVPMIPEEQWEMPVSITPDGRWITLREFADQKIVTLSSRSLPEQLAPTGQEAENWWRNALRTALILKWL